MQSWSKRTGVSGSRHNLSFRCTWPVRISSAACVREQYPNFESARASPTRRVALGLRGGRGAGDAARGSRIGCSVQAYAERANQRTTPSLTFPAKRHILLIYQSHISSQKSIECDHSSWERRGLGMAALPKTPLPDRLWSHSSQYESRQKV